MRISRIKISNFANFSELDIETSHSIVIVGENKVSKSNFIRALFLNELEARMRKTEGH